MVFSNLSMVETQAHNADEIIKAAESLKKFLEETPEGREAVSRYILNIHNSDAGVVGD